MLYDTHTPENSDVRLAVSWPLVAAVIFPVFCGIALWSASHDRVNAAFWAGMVAAGATAAGTLPLLFAREFSPKAADCCMGFGAGVMLAASVFSLIIPAIESAQEAGASKYGASILVGASIVGGAALVMLLQAFGTNESGSIEKAAVRKVWLFVLTVGLHNLPEGLAIGVGFGGVSKEQATVLAFGIALQDVPEGMIVAAALRSIGYSRMDSIACGIISGLVEPLAAAAGASIVSLFAPCLPWALGGAAGAMLFVLAHEVIPDPHQGRNALPATCWLMTGFVVMMVMDTALS